MARLTNRRLLVVDNHMDTLELFKVAFEAEGATVVAVTSASDALTTLDKEQFHSLLCEIVLPDLNGWDLLRRVRTKAQKWSNIPAIAVTGFVTQTTEQDIQAAGYVGYFPKPVDLDELVAAMAALTHPIISYQYQSLIAATS